MLHYIIGLIHVCVNGIVHERRLYEIGTKLTPILVHFCPLWAILFPDPTLSDVRNYIQNRIFAAVYFS